MAINQGMEFERIAIELSKTGIKDSDVSRDYVTANGTRVECKFFKVKNADNYLEKHAEINSANGHEWVRNEQGEIDYLASVEKFASECDMLKVGIGATADNCKVYWLRTKTDIYNFYFTRIQYRDDKTCRLCYNPISKTAGGRAKQLRTLEKHGVINVPTFDEIEARHKPLK